MVNVGKPKILMIVGCHWLIRNPIWVLWTDYIDNYTNGLRLYVVRCSNKTEVSKLHSGRGLFVNVPGLLATSGASGAIDRICS